MVAENPALAERLARIEDRIEKLAKAVEDSRNQMNSRLVRVANAQAIYLGEDTALTQVDTGQRIYVDTRSDEVGGQILMSGRWDGPGIALLRRLVKPGASVLDLGAGFGVHTLNAALLAGAGGRVEAFEPHPRVAALLRRTLRANGLTAQVSVHEALPGEAMGRSPRLLLLDGLDAAADEANSGTAAKLPGAVTADCRTVSLDEYFPDPAFRADVVRMALGGAEGLALRGMQNLAERSPEMKVMLDFAPMRLRRAGFGAAETVAVIEDLGLQIFAVEGNLRPVLIEPSALATSRDGVRTLLLSRTAEPF